MKLGWLLGLFLALGAHLGGLVFVGLYFFAPEGGEDDGGLRTVELLSEVEQAQEEEKKDEPEPQDPEQEMETEEEAPPDAEEVLKSLDAATLDATPALEAASLGAIEAALSGIGGAGDFGESLSFASGGRIGGTGTLGGGSDQLDAAFDLDEIDQPPRAVFQASPVYPSEMRGKKVEGLVTVEFVVDATGKVENARIQKSSHAAFETPALNAVRKWKFEPGVRGGQRVPSKMRAPIRFPAS